MTKLMLICLVLSVMCTLWVPVAVDAKPFFFKFFNFNLPQSAPSTTRDGTQTSTSSNVHYTDFITRKLSFLSGLLTNGGSVNYNFGFNKFAHVAPTSTTTRRPTTSSKPETTTAVDTVFVPDSTEALNESSTTERVTSTTTEKISVATAKISTTTQKISTTTELPAINTSSTTATNEDKNNPDITVRPQVPVVTTTQTVKNPGVESTTSMSVTEMNKEPTTTKIGYEYSTTKKPTEDVYTTSKPVEDADKEATTTKAGYVYTTTQKPNDYENTTKSSGYNYVPNPRAVVPLENLDAENEIDIRSF